MPQINTSLITSLPGDDIATRDLNFSNVGQAFNAGLARSDPLEKLKRLNLEQELQMNALHLSNSLKAKQDTLNAEAFMQANADQLRSILESGDPIKAKRDLLDMGSRNPYLLKSQSFTNLMGQTDAALAAKREQQRFEMQMETERTQQATAKAQLERAKALAQGNGTTAMGTNVDLLNKHLDAAKAAKAYGDMQAYERHTRLARFIEGSRNAPENAQRQVKQKQIASIDSLLANPLSMVSEAERADLAELRDELYRSLSENTPVVAPVETREPPFVPGTTNTIGRFRVITRP